MKTKILSLILFAFTFSAQAYLSPTQYSTDLLSALTANRTVITNSSGHLAPSSITAAQLASFPAEIDALKTAVENSIHFYVDSGTGKDSSSTCGLLNPCKTIEKALTLASNPSSVYSIFLQPGTHGSGEAIAWPKNVSLMGKGASITNVNKVITYTAGSGDQANFELFGVTAPNLNFDLSAASIAIISLRGGSFGITRTDASPPGPKYLGIFNSNIGASDLSGLNFVVGCNFVSSLSVQDNSTLLLMSSIFGITADLYGSAAIFASGSLTSGTLVGHTVLGNTPKIYADSTAFIFPPTLSNVDLVYLTKAERTAYTPAISGDWPVAPAIVSDALDDLIALVNGKEPAISAGTSSQYFRGDKTFQELDTLAVTENTNLYFTNDRARGAVSATGPLSYDSLTGIFSLPGFTETYSLHVGPGRLYTTIQAALNAVGNAASAAQVKQPWTIFIEPGTYDEALTIPQGRIITLVAQGTVILGNGAGSNWASTNSRSITFTANNADVFGSDIKPALTIMAQPAADPTSTFIAESGSFFLSGDINIAGNGLSHTVNLNSVKVAGIFNKTATGLTNLQGYRWLQVGVVSAPTSTILERCFECEFDALVTVDSFNAVIDSEFKAGMTVAANSNTLPPSGFFNTSFTGTFTGPANSLKLDAASNYFFNANGASLGGSASKVLLSLTGTNSVTEETNLYFTNARARSAVSVTAPLSYNSSTGVFSIPQATSLVDGYLAALDWVIFNAKEPAITATTSADYYRGDKTFSNFNTAARAAISATAPVTFSGGGVIAMPAATNSVNGYLLATDWVIFNAKQAAGNYVTAGTGDASFSGPGSASVTVNSVGGKTASAIGTAVTDVQAASSPSTPNTIVKRDSSGNFSAGNITAGFVYSPSDPGTWTAQTGESPGFVARALDLIIQKIASLGSGGSKETLYTELTGASCAKSLGTTADAGWNNIGSVTCTVTERVGVGISGFTQVSGEYGIKGTLNAHTYEICNAFHYEQQTSGVSSRITQSFRMAICSGTSACATTGQTYYIQPYMDMISPAVGAGLHSIVYRACFTTTIGSAGTYSINMQENTTNNSGTVGSNDFGCNGSENACGWSIKQVD